MTVEMHESRAEITVSIEDMNDNWPRFDEEIYREDHSYKSTLLLPEDLGEKVGGGSLMIEVCQTIHSG